MKSVELWFIAKLFFQINIKFGCSYKIKFFLSWRKSFHGNTFYMPPIDSKRHFNKVCSFKRFFGRVKIGLWFLRPLWSFRAEILATWYNESYSFWLKNKIFVPLSQKLAKMWGKQLDTKMFRNILRYQLNFCIESDRLVDFWDRPNDESLSILLSPRK
jgi:hypothetical protein